MIFFLSKIFLHMRYTFTVSLARKLHPLENPLIMLCARCISGNANQDSFVASYLINTCGFSPESALSASNYVHFKNPDKPDAVLAFFESHGFSKHQISKIVKRYPQVLLSNPEKTLLPKLRFFYSKGASSLDAAKIFATYPSIVARSLEKQIIPSFNFFKEFLQSEERIINAVKRFPSILTSDLQLFTVPNIDILRGIGVPKLNLATVLHYHPSVILRSTDRFKEIVEEVKGMGFDPLKLKFVSAVSILGKMSKSTRERKVEAYRKSGLSEEEILMAFMKQPWCMALSEDAIIAKMNFFVNMMGLEPSVIARLPNLLSLSLEKRIIPRASVAQVLVSKGLLKKEFSLSRLFISSSETLFLERYVFHYKEEASELLDLYKEKMNLSG